MLKYTSSQVDCFYICCRSNSLIG